MREDQRDIIMEDIERGVSDFKNALLHSTDQGAVIHCFRKNVISVLDGHISLVSTNFYSNTHAQQDGVDQEKICELSKLSESLWMDLYEFLKKHSCLFQIFEESRGAYLSHPFSDLQQKIRDRVYKYEQLIFE